MEDEKDSGLSEGGEADAELKLGSGEGGVLIVTRLVFAVTGLARGRRGIASLACPPEG